MTDIFSLISAIYTIGFGITGVIAYQLLEKGEVYTKIYMAFLVATVWPYAWYRALTGLIK